MSNLASPQTREVAAEVFFPGRASGASPFAGPTAESVGMAGAAAVSANRMVVEGEGTDPATPATSAGATEVEKQALLDRLKAGFAGAAAKGAETKMWYQKPGVWIGLTVAVVAVGVIGWKAGWFGK